MADTQPATLVEGATTGDVDDELSKNSPPLSATKPSASAEDRKAASALANLNAVTEGGGGGGSRHIIDQEAASKAMHSLGPASAGAATAGASRAPAVPKKSVKVDPVDVALLVEQLELSKPKATDLLKSHDGNAVAALRAYVRAP